MKLMTALTFDFMASCVLCLRDRRSVRCEWVAVGNRKAQDDLPCGSLDICGHESGGNGQECN